MTRGLVGAVVVGLASAVLWSCLGSMAANRAAEVAAQQHNCPPDRVRGIGDGGQWQYWLDVCGRRRLYTTQGGRYEDITASVGADSPAVAPQAQQPAPGVWCYASTGALVRVQAPSCAAVGMSERMPAPDGGG